MNGWRAALRIAWREARRSRGRSALVIALILVPVAALSFVNPDELAEFRKYLDQESIASQRAWEWEPLP